MIKRIISVFICALLLFACTVSVSASKDSMIPRVHDAAKLLSATEYTSLLNKLDTISEEYNCDIIVATVPSLLDYTIEEYSDDLYSAVNYGMGETKDGFMLAICIGSRDWALTSYGNAGKKFSDSKITYVRESIMSDLSDDNFYDAFDTFADKSEEVLENYGKVTLKPLWILVALLIGVAIAFITVFIMKSQLRSVRSQPAANNYLKDGSLMVTTKRDIFLYSTITRRAKPQQTSGGKIGAPGPRQSGKF